MPKAKSPGKRVVTGTSRSRIRGLLRHLAMVMGDADNAAYANYVKGAAPPKFIFWDDKATANAANIIRNRCLFALNARYLPAELPQ